MDTYSTLVLSPQPEDISTKNCAPSQSEDILTLTNVSSQSEDISTTTDALEHSLSSCDASLPGLLLSSTIAGMFAEANSGPLATTPWKC